MNGRLASHIKSSVFGVLVLAGLSPAYVRAQADSTNTPTSRHHESTQAQKSGATGLVKVVPRIDQALRDVAVRQG